MIMLCCTGWRLVAKSSSSPAGSLLSPNPPITTSSTSHQTSETTSLLALPSLKSTASSWSLSSQSSPAPLLTQQSPSSLSQSPSAQFSSTIAASPTSASPKGTSTPSPQTTRAPSITSNTGLDPGSSCTANNQCQSPNICYTNSDGSNFCCGTNVPGCPGSPCSANTCLDPYGCRTEAGTCCGLPPYTRLKGPTCYTWGSQQHEEVNGLKARGLSFSILTGDNAAEAQRISEQLGIPVLASSATPSTKLEYIKSLQAAGHKVAMVGDVINDGPSLAASDIGIMIV